MRDIEETISVFLLNCADASGCQFIADVSSGDDGFVVCTQMPYAAGTVLDDEAHANLRGEVLGALQRYADETGDAMAASVVMRTRDGVTVELPKVYARP